jgi:hypothetical protein
MRGPHDQIFRTQSSAPLDLMSRIVDLGLLLACHDVRRAAPIMAAAAPSAIEHFFSQVTRVPWNAYERPQLVQNGSASATKPPQAALSSFRIPTMFSCARPLSRDKDQSIRAAQLFIT